ncbi:hypothetical protein KVR01_004126 [Diaporthe batatas]|uniref:uncharacterized protein n=1 Tax=Diaporthe batatas TaxID=748121 RepID=UPI001D0487AF|nr:uncharacterized protein KVR01_004126 [Diaporthe batatas]KAG8165574.1 hypothetical protein KVR01_004126 [Diaporthe batatas]
MAALRWQKRLYAAMLATLLAATQEAQAAVTNSSATATSRAPLPTGGSGHDKPCEIAAGSVMIWDWRSPVTAGTVTHTIVPHITAYPNGSSVTNNQTVMTTLPTTVSTNSTMVVSGFTMTYPSIWAQYSYIAFSDCAVSTSTETRGGYTVTSTDTAAEPSWTSTTTMSEDLQRFTIQSGIHFKMPATVDPARFFYRAEGWDYDDNNPSTVTAPLLEYLNSLETVREQAEGQDLSTCIFASCAPTAVGHSMVSATVLVESTTVGPAVYYNAPTEDPVPALPISTPKTTSPTTQPPPPPASTSGNELPTGSEPPTEQQSPPLQAPDSPEVRPPNQGSVSSVSSVEVVIISTGGSGDVAVPETTFVRTTTLDGQAQEQTVVSPAPVANSPPGEVTLIREVTSNGQTLTETVISVSAPPPTKVSEETIVTIVTGANGAESTLTLVSVAPDVAPRPSEVTLVTTATVDGNPTVQTIVSLAGANQGGNDSEGGVTAGPGGQALATTTRTIVSNGQTYVQTIISPVETASSPEETTFVRTSTSGGTTLVQTVVSRLGGGADGDENGVGSTPSATGDAASSDYTGPAVSNGGFRLDGSGKGLAGSVAIIAVGLILDL